MLVVVVGEHHQATVGDGLVSPEHRPLVREHLRGEAGPLADRAGDADRRGAIVGDRRHQHALQFSLIFGSHHREIGHGTQIADVVLALMGGAISPNDAGPIQHERDR